MGDTEAFHEPKEPGIMHWESGLTGVISSGRPIPVCRKGCAGL